MTQVLMRSLATRKYNYLPSLWVNHHLRFQSKSPNESNISEGGGALKVSRQTEINDISSNVRPLKEKITENTKTASYTAIIIAGISVTGILFWAIFRELFSSSSPNNVYSEALKLVKEDPRIQDALGMPIKGYGEESRRGRRQRVAHTCFERNGIPHMRMTFYVQGLRNKATVQLEARETQSGRMEYRYLLAQLDYYPHTTIILEDNRGLDHQVELTYAGLPKS